MPTGAERLDSSLDTQENELYEFSQKLNELNIQTLQSLNIKSPEAIKDG
ncbi:hypothetical protein IJM86_05745 [bacterium]|nr:hypothetical protein [bacterium]